MSNPEWRLIISDALPGALNMAFDEVLLDAVSSEESPPVLRFYQWEKPTVSLGYGQNFHTGVNLDFCRAAGLPVVRRITGGRAVIHDQELTYSFISPEKNALFPGTIQGNYLIIAEALKDALRHFQIPAELAPGKREKKSIGTRSYRHNACFNSPSIHELVVNGCKITGSAQVRRQGFFLQHGSIPVEMDLALAVQALSPGRLVSVPEETERLARKVGWLNRFSPQLVSLRELREQIIGAFSRRLGTRFSLDGFTPTELRKAEFLREMKYDHPLWNRHRKMSVETSHGDGRN